MISIKCSEGETQFRDTLIKYFLEFIFGTYDFFSSLFLSDPQKIGSESGSENL